MSSRKLKKRLQQDLRAKRTKRSPLRLIGGTLLLSLGFAGAFLLWHHQRPASLLEQGVRLEQQAKIDEALQAYRQLFENYKADPAASEALIRSAQIEQYDRGDAQRALLYYLKFENDYPQHRQLVVAQREAANLTKNQLNDCGQAIPIYQRLVERADEKADNDLYEIADCYVREENWEQAAIEFETLLKNYPESELGQLVRYRLANAWLLSGQREKARQGFRQISLMQPDDTLTEEARFKLAEMLEEDEHLKDALKAYSQLTRYPRQELLKQKILKLKERIARKKKVL